MKVFITNNNHKYTIIFIHGFMKHYNSWNVTEGNKVINIEKNISKICNTVLVQIEEEDYMKPIDKVANEIYVELQPLLHTNITLGCHSYGSFYCISLAINYPKIFSRIVMLNPSIKTQAYYDYLATKDQTDINTYKLKHFDELPDHTNIHNKIIISIHVNLDSTKYNEDKLTLFDKMIQLNKMTNKNVKSKLYLYVYVSHMIHYKISDKIYQSIKDIYKLT